MSLTKTLILALAFSVTQAVRLDAEPRTDLSLEADLSLPLRVSLGDARFIGRDCGCEVCDKLEEAELEAEAEEAALLEEEEANFFEDIETSPDNFDDFTI